MKIVYTVRWRLFVTPDYLAHKLVVNIGNLKCIYITWNRGRTSLFSLLRVPIECIEIIQTLKMFIYISTCHYVALFFLFQVKTAITLIWIGSISVGLLPLIGIGSFASDVRLLDYLVSKWAKIWLSKSIFYVKNHLNLFHWRANFFVIDIFW